MCRDVWAGGIKGQPTPAATECGDPAITVGKADQPCHASGRGIANLGRHGPLLSGFQSSQGKHCARSVVGIGHAARQVGPGPATRFGAGVGMHLVPLLAEEPAANGLTLGRIENGPELTTTCQCLNGERRAPGGEVGVNWP